MCSSSAGCYRRLSCLGYSYQDQLGFSVTPSSSVALSSFWRQVWESTLLTRIEKRGSHENLLLSNQENPYDWLAYDPEPVYHRGMDIVMQGESQIDEYERDFLDGLVPSLRCDEIGILQDMMRDTRLKSYIDILHYRHCPEPEGEVA